MNNYQNSIWIIIQVYETIVIEILVNIIKQKSLQSRLQDAHTVQNGKPNDLNKFLFELVV